MIKLDKFYDKRGVIWQIIRTDDNIILNNGVADMVWLINDASGEKALKRKIKELKGEK